jgi:capsular polysaccharide biosynthesis protein
LFAEEAGILVVEGAYAYDIGMVIKENKLLLDLILTVVPNELGAWGWYDRVERLENGNFRIRDPIERSERLARAVVLLRRGYNVHGHWLLEVMPRALAALKSAGDDATFIIAADSPAYHIEMLEALGVPRERLFRLGRNELVWCDELWIPSVAHANQLWVHPYANETYNALIEHVREPHQSSGEDCERIFVTRSTRARDPRPLLNCAHLEEIALESGYKVLDPGIVPWREQIKFFARARKVVGLSGSGLHNTVYTSRNAHVGVLQLNQNFNYLQSSIAAIRGHDVSYLIGDTLSAFDEVTWEAAYLIDHLLFKLFLQRLL